MRWFKHHANFADDPAVAHFLALHGLDGYGFLMRLYEIVCAQFSNDGEPEVGFPIGEWCRRLGVHRNRLNRLLLAAVAQDLVRAVVVESLPPDASAPPRQLASNPRPNPQFFERFSLCSPRDTLILHLRKLLVWRDEYSRKSGHAADKVAPETDQHPDSERGNIAGCDLLEHLGGKGGNHPPPDSPDSDQTGGAPPGPPGAHRVRPPTDANIQAMKGGTTNG